MLALANATLHWLAARPPVEGALTALAGTPLVQELASRLLGHQDVQPVNLLSFILSLVLIYLIFLTIVPKARLATWSVWYFLASGDKKTRKPDDAAMNFNSPSCRRMKVVFIRHGESEWNAVFNKGSKLTLPIRLVRALVKEALMLFDQDSLFIDSPLSKVGINQGWDLLTFLAAQKAGCLTPGMASRPAAELEVCDLVSIIRGDAGESVVVSSILRRAVSTGMLCLSPRLLKTPQKDKIVLMTSLQEISRNVDTLALTPSRSLPQVPAAEASLKNMGDLMSHFYRTRLEKKWNMGNKTLKQKAKQRQEQFVNWVFEQKDSVDCIIVCGHSLWFREFFKSYLPKACIHTAKTSKMVNCGCVAFDLYKDSQVLRINPASIKEVYGGFETKGKHKKA
uniref:Uncharacterized protein n=1 Tax=Alexandrium monilatum TaxID=311494 RepID=A0A6T0R787_9DINO|mmetsp:Transcript_4625/g.13758  ORF Transcript_4625/g.13758 Transcript_4625/m.13758 type:complete len:395 (+) Transcript_4625:31-1215(+)